MQNSHDRASMPTQNDKKQPECINDPLFQDRPPVYEFTVHGAKDTKLFVDEDQQRKSRVENDAMVKSNYLVALRKWLGLD